MKQRPGIYYTESRKALMWERRQTGDSLQQIAQLSGRNRASIGCILGKTGGSVRRKLLYPTLNQKFLYFRGFAV
jgi:hypothetical protein